MCLRAHLLACTPDFRYFYCVKHTTVLVDQSFRSCDIESSNRKMGSASVATLPKSCPFGGNVAFHNDAYATMQERDLALTDVVLAIADRHADSKQHE
jgi:hypothetical protein